MSKRSVLFGLFVSLIASVLSAQGTFTTLTPTNVVRVETTIGTFDIQVDPEHAPITTANFLRYVAGGFYDAGEFYRAARPDTYHAVLPNRPPMELIEARIHTGQTPYPPIPLERTSVTGLHHVAGTVAMGRNDDQPDSAAFDFYILLNDQPSLDFGGKRFDDAQGTAAFGKVVAGMDVVRKINEQAVGSRAATADNPLTKTQNLDPPIPIMRAYRIIQSQSGLPSVATRVNWPTPTPPSSIDLRPNSIGGVVYEITRAPLAGATVTLSAETMPAPRVATTDRDGKFLFEDVPPGTYTVTFESFGTPGFKRAARPNIVMRSGQSVRADCMLEWSGAPWSLDAASSPTDRESREPEAE